MGEVYEFRMKKALLARELNKLRYDRERFKHYLDTYHSLGAIDDRIADVLFLLGEDDAA